MCKRVGATLAVVAFLIATGGVLGVTNTAAATSPAAPSVRPANPVTEQVRRCGEAVRQILSVARALSAKGKVAAALAVASCAGVAGAWLGLQSVDPICRSTHFWGPFGAASRAYVRFVTGGQYSRC